MTRGELALFALTAALFVGAFFALFLVLQPERARALLGARAHAWLAASAPIQALRRELLESAARARAARDAAGRPEL